MGVGFGNSSFLFVGFLCFKSKQRKGVAVGGRGAVVFFCFFESG